MKNIINHTYNNYIMLIIKRNSSRILSLWLLIIGLLPGTQLQAQENLSLSDAIRIGLRNNYNITVQKNKEKIAGINNTWGNTSIMPTLTLNVTGQDLKNNNDTEDYNSVTFTPLLSLNWTVFDGFSAKITKQTYEKLQEESENNTALLVEETIENIILAYNSSLVQKELMNVYKDMSDLSKDLMNRADVSKEIGASTSFEYLQYKTSYLNDYSFYLKQKVVYENSLRSLNYLLADNNNTMRNLTTELIADTTYYVFSDLQSQMNSNNENLKLQYLNQKILSLNIELAKSNLYPTVSLNAGGRNNYLNKDFNGNSQTINTNTNDLYAGFTASWNLFSGGIVKRAIQIAKINKQSSDVEIDDMKHSLDNKLLQLISSYDVNKSIYNLTQEQIKSAKLNLNISGDKYKSGAINSFDYRAVQLTYLNAVVSNLESVYDLIESNVNILKITGNIVGLKENNE